MSANINIMTDKEIMGEAESKSPNEKSLIEKGEIEELRYETEPLEESDGDSEVEMRNGEPVIQNGRDVSRYLVDIRDDGDQALTFRSMVLGTVFAGLGAALGQVRSHHRIIRKTLIVVLSFFRYTYSSPSRLSYRVSS